MILSQYSEKKMISLKKCFLFSILAATDSFDAKIFFILSSAGHTALMPLLYPDELTVLKFILFTIYLTGSILLFFSKSQLFKLHLLEKLYIGLLLFVTFYETILHKLIFQDKLPFLPLAITSIYCALGVLYSYVKYYYYYIFNV